MSLFQDKFQADDGGKWLFLKNLITLLATWDIPQSLEDFQPHGPCLASPFVWNPHQWRCTTSAQQERSSLGLDGSMNSKQTIVMVYWKFQSGLGSFLSRGEGIWHSSNFWSEAQLFTMVHEFNGLDRTWSTHAPTTRKASWISVSALRVSTYSLAEQVGQERPVIFCKKNRRIAVSIKRLWTLRDISRLPLRCIAPGSAICRCQTSPFLSKKKTQRIIRLYSCTVIPSYNTTTPNFTLQFLYGCFQK